MSSLKKQERREEEMGIAAFESLTRWTVEARRLLLAAGTAVDSSFSLPPLLVELLGMGGTMKTSLVNEISSKYFNSLGIDCLVFQEPQMSLSHVSNKDKEAFLRAEFDRARQNLETALRSVKKDLVLFDRGWADMIVWINLEFVYKVIGEEECKRLIGEVMNLVRQRRIDLVFVHMGSVERSLKGKAMLRFASFMTSFGLGGKSWEQTFARHMLIKMMYERFYLEDEAMRSCFRRMVKMDVEECKRNLDIMMRRAVVNVDLYLVFKTWQALANKLGRGKIAESRELLRQCHRSLRERVKALDSRDAKELKQYEEEEFEIGHINGSLVKVRDVFREFVIIGI